MSRLLEPVSATPGASGYFSERSPQLDPHLFSGGAESAGVRPEICKWMLDTLYGYWETQFKNPRQWSTVWIAGSGISYQWDANRGNGDLDILIGVDWPLFFRHNDRYLGFGESDMADIMNTGMKQDLWPKTAETEFSSTAPGGLTQGYEVTYYVNPGSTDIRDIKPYAAYDLTHNRWVVHPPDSEQTSHKSVPKEWWDHVEDERRMADSLVSRYNGLATQAKVQPAESPGWHNTMRMIEVTTAQAQSMFDDIHLGRKNAFGSGGEGYGDFHNFRWQAHKQFGSIQALNQLGKAQQTAREETQAQLYGAQVEPAAVSLRRAALWNRGGNGR